LCGWAFPQRPQGSWEASARRTHPYVPGLSLSLFVSAMGAQRRSGRVTPGQTFPRPGGFLPGKGKEGGESPFGGSFGGPRGVDHPCGGQFPSEVGRDRAQGDFATVEGFNSDSARLGVAPGAFATRGRPPRRRIGLPGARAKPSSALGPAPRPSPRSGESPGVGGGRFLLRKSSHGATHTNV